MKISVAMAVYNGEKYIEKQINSIIGQLKEEDELIISYNHSIDKTEEIIRHYQEKDKRIKFYICEKKGVINNFENAVLQCKNEIIFLSDQDDIWVNSKVETILKYFENPEIAGVVHGCKFIDKNDNLLEIQPQNKSKLVSILDILIKNPVQGSCLAFRKDFIKYISPFPSIIPMHDSWIGMFLAKYGKLIIIKDELLLYRQHEQSVTTRKHLPLQKMIKNRCLLFIAYMKRIYQIKNVR